jgi:hypothetical protein
MNFEDWWTKECTPYVRSGLAHKEIAETIWDAAIEQERDTSLQLRQALVSIRMDSITWYKLPEHIQYQIAEVLR